MMDVLSLPNGDPGQSGQTPLKLAILYCGKMGTAILQGLVSATLLERGDLADVDSASSTSTSPPVGTSIRILHISVVARRVEEISRIRADVQAVLGLLDTNLDGTTDQKQKNAPKSGLSVSVALATPGNTTDAIQTADVIFLCCKPYMYKDVLSDASLKGALTGGPRPKVLVSVLGGVSTLDLEECLGLVPIANATHSETPLPLCTVVRVIPNLAARIHQSMTVVATSRTAVEENAVDLVTRIFSVLGAVRQLPETQFNIASALASSAIAFHARLIASAAHGSDLVFPAGYDGDRLSFADALWISAHAARGASGLILDGEHPDDIVNLVATKGGSTEVGLQTMQANKVEDAMTSAIVSCAQKTANLGMSTKS